MSRRRRASRSHQRKQSGRGPGVHDALCALWPGGRPVVLRLELRCRHGVQTIRRSNDTAFQRYGVPTKKFLAPTERDSDSPGQRPGKSGKTIAFLSPEGARQAAAGCAPSGLERTIGALDPRALPWAVTSHPFRVKRPRHENLTSITRPKLNAIGDCPAQRLTR